MKCCSHAVTAGLTWSPGDPFELAYGVPDLMMSAPYLPIGMAFAIPFVVAFTATSWRSAYWSVGERIHYALVTTVLVLFVIVLDYWNLLGFHL